MPGVEAGTGLDGHPRTPRVVHLPASGGASAVSDLDCCLREPHWRQSLLCGEHRLSGVVEVVVDVATSTDVVAVPRSRR
jgi:hypothetical protein